MKYIICVLFATLCVSVATALKLEEEEGHYYDNRIRAGHFNDYPYTDLYKYYVQVFVAPAWDGTKVHETDSYKNYAASAEQCFNFFDRYFEDGYELQSLEKLVLLDACLGYLYDPEYLARHHKIDSQREIVSLKLQSYIDNQKLKDLYQNTKIHELDRDAKVCIADLLIGTIMAHKQFSDRPCNNHHIALMNKFGECHKAIPQDIVPTDSYLSLLYQLVRSKGRKCFDSELLATNDAIRKKYIDDKTRIFHGWSKQGAQSNERMYPPEMRELFTAVQGLRSKNDLLNIREIFNMVKASYERKSHPENLNYVRTLLNNMAWYADKTIVPSKPADKSLGDADTDGRLRYSKMVNNLCKHFRTTDVEDKYDFATSYARLVHMLDFPELYGISRKNFIDSIVTNGWEATGTYACLVSCNVLTYTRGTIQRTAAKRKAAYKVFFLDDTSGMVTWPDQGFY